MGGDPLLKFYNGSPFLLLSTVYDNYDWLPGKFSKQPKQSTVNTLDTANLIDATRAKIEIIAQNLNIKFPADWYNVSQDVNIQQMPN